MTRHCQPFIYSLIYLTFAACGEIAKMEANRNLSVLEVYSGQTCTLHKQNSNEQVKTNCENLGKFIDKNGDWCKNDNFIPSYATFPNQKKQMRLCSEAVSQNLKNQKTIRFFALGDTGAGQKPSENYRQLQVAQAMHAVCPPKSINNDNFNCDFALILGDAMYPSGITDVWDLNFDYKFEDMYKHFNNFPFYIFPGNHDYEGNIKAQLEYSWFSSRWIMPSVQYNIENLPNWLNIQIIDTESIIQKNEFVISAKNSTNCQPNRWQIIAGHHPSHSNGSHGNHSHIIDFLDQTKTSCPMDLYLSGHDHHLEHTQAPLYDSFVLGAGGTHIKDVKIKSQQKAASVFSSKNSEQQLFAKSTHGFAVIEVNQETMDIYLYDARKWEYDDSNSKYLVNPNWKQPIYHCQKKNFNSPCLPKL